MSSGNFMVDQMERDGMGKLPSSCNGCGGQGYIPWHHVKDEEQKFKDEVYYRIWHPNQHGMPIKTRRQIGAIIAYVRKLGAECPECQGRGEL